MFAVAFLFFTFLVGFICQFWNILHKIKEIFDPQKLAGENTSNHLMLLFWQEWEVIRLDGPIACQKLKLRQLFYNFFKLEAVTIRFGLPAGMNGSLQFENWTIGQHTHTYIFIFPTNKYNHLEVEEILVHKINPGTNKWYSILNLWK